MASNIRTSVPLKRLFKMNKLVNYLLACFLTALCPGNVSHAGDTVKVSHEYYTSFFVQSAHIPCLVTYTLRGADISCNPRVARTNNFRADPGVEGANLKKDYASSGYDKGHNMSAEDNDCSSVGMSECFYFTNMFPQTPNLNRGIWKKLEERERKLAIEDDSVVVFIGSYEKSGVIGEDGVWVPQYCWKAIYIPSSGQWEVHSFTNTDRSEEVGIPAGQQAWIRYCIHHFTGYKPDF